MLVDCPIDQVHLKAAYQPLFISLLQFQRYQKPSRRSGNQTNRSHIKFNDLEVVTLVNATLLCHIYKHLFLLTSVIIASNPNIILHRSRCFVNKKAATLTLHARHSVKVCVLIGNKVFKLTWQNTALKNEWILLEGSLHHWKKRRGIF